MKIHAKLPTSFLMFACLCLFFFTRPADGGMSIDEYRELRERALSRQRRIIFNSDGADAVAGGYRNERPEATPEGFLGLWTTGLLGTQVDSIFYCTTRGTFGQFNHYTEVGEVFTETEGRYWRNIVGALIEQGTCPLRLQSEFAREHGMEIFLSARMNDTHDAGSPLHDPESTASKFKQENPGFLLGSHGSRPPHGAWSAVNYAVPEVREFMFRLLEEACVNFDLDGIELDFFRHPVFFKHEPGKPVGDREREMMTGLIRRLRRMTEEVGMEKGRPILIAVRVPDSVEYSRAVGLDIEKWLSEGLVDILITTCYFRINPWSYSVELGHRYGVKVYPSLSESRVLGRKRHRGRASDSCYRARAMSAWESGADGIYMYNLFQARRPIYRQMGSPETLAHLDKIYYASVRGGKSGAGRTYPHERFITIPTVNPDEPVAVMAGKPEVFELVIGDDLEAALEKGLMPSASLDIQTFRVFEPGEIIVKFNGRVLENPSSSVTGEDDLGRQITYSYPLRAEDVLKGTNRAEISSSPGLTGLRYVEDLLVKIAYSRD